MLNFLAWVVAGGLLGAAASWLIRGEATPGVLLNVAAGVVAAFVAGLGTQAVLLANHLTTSPFSVLTLTTALAGATALLAVVNLRRRTNY